MTDRLKWRLSLAGFSVLLCVLMITPQLLHMRSPLYSGVSVMLNSDEAVYLARVQESLSGRPQQAAEAFTGHPSLVGTQDAFIERWYGILFRFTGWNAATVLNVLDGIVPVLVFLSLTLFFRLCGFRRWQAFAGAAAFCFIELYNLNRPVHMRASFFLMLWSLIGIAYAVSRKWWGILLGGVLLGMIIGVYFWSFSFAWAFWGIYFAWEFLEWAHGKWQERRRLAHSRVRRFLHTTWDVFWHLRPRRPTWKPERWHILGITGVIGLASGLPAIAHLVQTSLNPLYEYGVFRSGMHPGHMPESIPYSVLFGVMVASVLVANYKQYDLLRPYHAGSVLILTAFVYMNQQVVHGVIFNFVSHGIFSLASAAIVMVLLFVSLRNKWLSIGAMAACVYLAAIAVDGRYVLSQWTVEEGRFSTQYLSTALPTLDSLPHGRILSDPDTQSFIAAYTDHDVAYSVYLKNVLMTHQELAVRFCLSFLPLRPELRNLSSRHHLIFPDASEAFGSDVRAQEEKIVAHACREVDLDPATAIRTFEISYIFWNTRLQPEWDVSRLGVNLTEIASGDGWILYRIEQ